MNPFKFLLVCKTGFVLFGFTPKQILGQGGSWVLGGDPRKYM